LAVLQLLVEQLPLPALIVLQLAELQLGLRAVKLLTMFRALNLPA
jgi:hypothetical protein